MGFLEAWLSHNKQKTCTSDLDKNVKDNVVHLLNVTNRIIDNPYNFQLFDPFDPLFDIG